MFSSLKKGQDVEDDLMPAAEPSSDSVPTGAFPLGLPNRGSGRTAPSPSSGTDEIDRRVVAMLQKILNGKASNVELSYLSIRYTADVGLGGNFMVQVEGDGATQFNYRRPGGGRRGGLYGGGSRGRACGRGGRRVHRGDGAGSRGRGRVRGRGRGFGHGRGRFPHPAALDVPEIPKCKRGATPQDVNAVVKKLLEVRGWQGTPVAQVSPGTPTRSLITNLHGFDQPFLASEDDTHFVEGDSQSKIASVFRVMEQVLWDPPIRIKYYD